jgi:hypothetical protein
MNHYVASNSWCSAWSFEFANMVYGGEFTVWYV